MPPPRDWAPAYPRAAKGSVVVVVVVVKERSGGGDAVVAVVKCRLCCGNNSRDGAFVVVEVASEVKSFKEARALVADGNDDDDDCLNGREMCVSDG